VEGSWCVGGSAVLGMRKPVRKRSDVREGGNSKVSSRTYRGLQEKDLAKGVTWAKRRRGGLVVGPN